MLLFLLMQDITNRSLSLLFAFAVLLMHSQFFFLLGLYGYFFLSPLLSSLPPSSFCGLVFVCILRHFSSLSLSLSRVSLVSSPSCLRLAFLIVFLLLLHRENEEEYRRRRRRKKKTSSIRYTPSSIDAVRRHCRIIIGKGFSLSLFFSSLLFSHISIFDFFYLLSSSSLILFHC